MSVDPAEDIMGALMAWLSTLREYSGRVAKDVGIGLTDLEALHELAQEGPVSSGLLARRLNLTTGAITHLVDRLEAAGLVGRGPDPADRRRVLVQILPEAAARLRRDYQPLEAATQATLRTLTAEEQDAVLRFLTAGNAGLRELL